LGPSRGTGSFRETEEKQQVKGERKPEGLTKLAERKDPSKAQAGALSEIETLYSQEGAREKSQTFGRGGDEFDRTLSGTGKGCNARKEPEGRGLKTGLGPEVSIAGKSYGF